MSKIAILPENILRRHMKCLNEYLGNDRDLWDEEAYDEGYKDGYNAAIDDVESKAEGLTWEIGSLKKN